LVYESESLIKSKYCGRRYEKLYMLMEMLYIDVQHIYYNRMYNNMVMSPRIKLPQSTLVHEEVKSLKPKEREDYVRGLISNILSLNENGVMVSEVAEATNLNRITATKHLEHLVAIREAYKRDRGMGAIYYKNGKLVHPTDRVSVKMGNKIYDFIKLENAEGEFMFIQEKEQDELRLTKIKGGIMIAYEDFSQFLSGLQKFMVQNESKLEMK
jgi:hypothetical protein